jgi:UDP:flavonoid glycosyltransferase YjiC (YdhE family)
MSGGGIRILFAGGGTGGHVFPGIALAQHAPGGAVRWLCTSRPFDAAQLSKENIPFEALESPRWRGFTGFLGPMARAMVALAVDRRRLHALGDGARETAEALSWEAELDRLDASYREICGALEAPPIRVGA